MTAGEVRTVAALIGELGTTNFKTAISANFTIAEPSGSARTAAMPTRWQIRHTPSARWSSPSPARA